VVVGTATTNALGTALIDYNTVPAGNYLCEITAPQVFADPVGPALVSTGTVPDRMYTIALTVHTTSPVDFIAGFVGHGFALRQTS